MSDQSAEMAENSVGPPDWSNVTEQMALQILDRGDRYLQSLHEIAASIDQRASTLASVFTTAAVAALAVLGATIETVGADLRFLIAGLTVTVTWFTASWFCIAAMMPAKFHVPGIHPATWYAAANGPLNEVLGYAAEEYQDRINDNLSINARATTRLKWGMRLGASAPALGFIAWLATWLIISWAAE